MELTGIRAMVVEDESLVSMMIEEYLMDSGCEIVATASHLDDGLAKATTIDVDIVMLDVNLGGQLSYPIAEMLRNRRIPFVFSTGYGLTGLPAMFDGTPVLSKPFSQAQLVSAVIDATRGSINSPEQ